MTAFQIAWLHFIRRKSSSLIAVLGIALAIAASGVLLRLYLLSAARFDSLPKASQGVIGAKAGGTEILLGSLNFEGPYPDFIPMNLFLTLKAQADIQFEDGQNTKTKFIKSITPLILFAQKDEFRIFGTDDSFLFPRAERPQIQSGRWAENPGEVVVGSQMAKKLNLNIEQSTTVTSWTSVENQNHISVPLKVVGILQETRKSWDRAAFTNLQTAEQVLNQTLPSTGTWGTKVLSYFLVDIQPGTEAALKSLINQRTVAQLIFVDQELEQLKKWTGSGRDLGFAITLVILTLGVFTATAMMMARFESMTAQLAVLRALGFSQIQLSCVMLFEALFVSLAAVLLGLLVDAASFPWICSLLGASLPSLEVISIPLWASFPVWTAAIIGTLFSILIPFFRLYRQDLHLSLRNL